LLIPEWRSKVCIVGGIETLKLTSGWVLQQYYQRWGEEDLDQMLCNANKKGGKEKTKVNADRNKIRMHNSLSVSSTMT
jgi:hypothetical protein